MSEEMLHVHVSAGTGLLLNLATILPTRGRSKERAQQVILVVFESFARKIYFTGLKTEFPSAL